MPRRAAARQLRRRRRPLDMQATMIRGSAGSRAGVGGCGFAGRGYAVRILWTANERTREPAGYSEFRSDQRAFCAALSARRQQGSPGATCRGVNDDRLQARWRSLSSRSAGRRAPIGCWRPGPDRLAGLLVVTCREPRGCTRRAVRHSRNRVARLNSDGQRRGEPAATEPLVVAGSSAEPSLNTLSLASVTRERFVTLLS